MGISDTKYESAKVIWVGGAAYNPGDPIDVSEMADHKIGQLLNQRIIRPTKITADPDTA